MNELCKLKGHMWFASKRKDIQRKDGRYSIMIERKCARCGEVEVVEK